MSPDPRRQTDHHHAYADREQQPHSHPHALVEHVAGRNHEKSPEMYMMTGRSAGSTEDDTQSVIHSLEIHPQYRGFKRIYYNPVIQVYFLGFVCFMGPGLFNALNGLGGGGMLDTTTSANANSALYATFAVAAFFAG